MTTTWPPAPTAPCTRIPGLVLSAALRGAADVQAGLDAVGDAIFEAWGTDRLSVSLVHGSPLTGDLEMIASWSAFDPAVAARVSSPMTPRLCDALINDEPIFEGERNAPHGTGGHGSSSSLAVPVPGHVHGFVTASRTTPGGMTQQQGAGLTAALREVGPWLIMLAELDLAREDIVTLRREGHRQAALAHTDGLTGLLNRRAWDIALEEELAGATLRQAPLSVVLLDIDHFKKYNDRFGHPAGDRLLEGAASRWGARIRGGDVLARVGGEEFGLILPGCPSEQAQRLVERLLFDLPDHQTASAGIAGLRWQTGDEPAPDGGGSSADQAGGEPDGRPGDEPEGIGQRLYDAADRALYRAKESGRHQCANAPAVLVRAWQGVAGQL